jgi:intracellular sulfur oxidation DsrE/DsrF family protein
MPAIHRFAVIVALLCCSVSPVRPVLAQGLPSPPVVIDVPVKLKTANVVFNNELAHFSGDLPTSLKLMRILHDNLLRYGAKFDMVGVFHGDATYLLLNDKAYNDCRGVTTGNPYKMLLKALTDDGVRIEVCAVALEAGHWSNADLLPAVKVNTGGLMRIIELTQKGYVQIQP